MTKKNGKTTCGKGFYVAYKVPTNLKKVCAKPSSHRKLSVITELASDLKQDKFGNAKFQAIDSMTNKPIANAEMRLYLNNQKCELLMQQPMLTLYSNENGEVIFSNLIQNIDYSLQVSSKGHKINCVNFNNVQESQTVSNFIVLMPSLKSKVGLTYLLTWKNPEIKLELQSTINQDKNNMCSVGFYNKECAGLSYKETQVLGKDFAYQSISSKQIGMYYYLFFLQKVPSTQKDLNIFSSTMSFSNNQHIDNNDLLKADAKVQLFVNELDYPVEDFELPEMKDSQKSDAKITWLVSCMNGNVGDVTTSPVGTFWNRSESDVRAHPTSGEICQKLYK